MTGRSWLGLIVAVLFASVGLISSIQAQGTGQPAEFPPAGYAGQQYVDSEGCVFVRAGTDAETLWVPRVTSGGKLLCGYPPSGNRVPVVGEAGAEEAVPAPDAGTAEPAAVAVAPAEPAPKPAPVEEIDEAGDFVVALGSFGFQSNVNKAMAAAEAFGYPVLTGQLEGGEQGLVTVFAGPFNHKSKAEQALKTLHEAGFPDAVLMRR